MVSGGSVAHAGGMNDTKTGPDRVLLIGAVVVGLIVVVAALVALTRSEPATLDPSTPEGTAQRYVQAILDGDNATAEDMILEEDCDIGPRFFGDQTVRARMVNSTVDGDTATVEVELVFSGGDPLFGGYGYEEPAWINLTQVDGTWMVDSDSWPYFPCEVDR